MSEIYPHRVDGAYPQDVHGMFVSNSHGCSPIGQQESSFTMDDMDGHTLDQPADYEPRSNMAFNMPASWQDMEYLGLNPLTGEPL